MALLARKQNSEPTVHCALIRVKSDVGRVGVSTVTGVHYGSVRAIFDSYPLPLVIRYYSSRTLDGSDLEMSDDENGFGMQYSSEEEMVDTFENRDPESYQFSTLSIDEVY